VDKKMLQVGQKGTISYKQEENKQRRDECLIMQGSFTLMLNYSIDLQALMVI
jgi:hypothetical protein